jgi:hypothetical protein
MKLPVKETVEEPVVCVTSKPSCLE